MAHKAPNQETGRAGTRRGGRHSEGPSGRATPIRQMFEAYTRERGRGRGRERSVAKGGGAQCLDECAETVNTHTHTDMSTSLRP